MSFTHICIAHVTDPGRDTFPNLKKGDYATLVEEHPQTPEGPRCPSKLWYKFKEDILWYCSGLFLPLPPPHVVYVAVPETIKESVPEPVLN